MVPCMQGEAIRNVLFVVADHWRGDCLSALGHGCARTPHLDRLAAEGVLFRRHFGQASPCGPARACLFTGMYLHNHRSVRNGTPLDARHTNIAREVRKAGYDPALFGYTDTSPDPRRLDPGDPALRSYEGILPGLTPAAPLVEDLLPWIAELRARGYAVPERPRDIYRPAAAGGGVTAAPPIYAAADSETAYLTDELLKYLCVRREQPWCALLCYIRPHPPFIAPEPYNVAVDPAHVPGPARTPTAGDEARQHPWLAYCLERQPGSPLYEGYEGDWRDLEDRDVRQLRATYYGLIQEVDANLGRIIAHLEATGAYDRTLIVVTSDHGEQLGDHWLWGKESYFDATFHTPLIVRDPRRAADAARGRVVDAFTEAVDVMPTVLDWLGRDVPRQCDGRSLLPFCTGESPADWRDEVHFELDFRDVAGGAPEAALGLSMDACVLNVIRDHRYKYVHFAALPPVFFDLEADPGERHNVADDPAYAKLLLRYAQRLLSWRMVHDDKVLTGMLITSDGLIERRGPPATSPQS